MVLLPTDGGKARDEIDWFRPDVRGIAGRAPLAGAIGCVCIVRG